MRFNHNDIIFVFHTVKNLKLIIYMKKNYFLILILLFSVFQAQILNIPDANFKTKLLSANLTNGVAKNNAGQNIIIDTNANSEIDISEALTVYRLEFYSSNITNLNGITGFTNLKNLKVGSMDVPSINLNGLSNLQVLDIGSFNALQSLNLSNFSQLQYVKVSNGMNLTSVILDNLPVLSQVVINTNTNLSSVAMTNLPALANLNCTSNNGLQQITLANFPLLTLVALDNNSLTSLQLLNVPMISKLTANNNEFTNLNVSMLPNLQEISVVFNQLTTLDLNASPLLHTVYVSENNLQSLKIKNGGQNFPSIFQMFNNPPFQNLCCDTEDITIATVRLNQQGYTSATVDSSCPAAPVLSSAETLEKSDQVSFYPNPVKDILYFKSKEKIVKAEIFDSLGRILKSQSINGDSITVSELSKGNYLIKLYTKDRFIIQNFIKN